MNLYHGTDGVFRSPEISKCNRYTDFGRGFYLTHELQRAKEWGKNHNPLKYRINVYEVDDDYVDLALRAGLRVKIFPTANAEWALFVYNNRYNIDFSHDYDIVLGPVADNALQVRFAEMQRYNLTFEQIATKINYKIFRKPQICFCSQRSLDLLKYKQVNVYTNGTSNKRSS